MESDVGVSFCVSSAFPKLRDDLEDSIEASCCMKKSKSTLIFVVCLVHAKADCSELGGSWWPLSCTLVLEHTKARYSP